MGSVIQTNWEETFVNGYFGDHTSMHAAEDMFVANRQDGCDLARANIGIAARVASEKKTRGQKHHYAPKASDEIFR
jgi:hypothetical protein